MLVSVPEVLSKEEVAHFRRAMDTAAWESGLATAGEQAVLVKNNRQLPQSSAVARELGERILSALSRNALFLSAALPLKILPPMFNRYAGGEHFGIHVDNAIRSVPQSGVYIRTDISCTLFLSEPDDYDGGELVVEDKYGGHEVKLPAGDLVLYPSTSLHKVEPVTRGERVASFFWLQSMIREDDKRAMLFDLDQTIQGLALEQGSDHAAVVKLTGIYHNLVRAWAET